jgi:NAD(P)H-dependent FMN reductase
MGKWIAVCTSVALMANAEKLTVGIILGSTRPNRKGEAVGQWVHALAATRDDADFELVDVKDFNLPLLDEPIPPSQGKYSQPHTKKWAATIDSFDAFVFVTPEYNHSTSGALKNAIDFLYKEWNNKAAGFVSYGSAGGVRAVEHLRLIMAELQVADVRAQVALSLATDFENYSTFKPAPQHERTLKQMLDQVLAWGAALKAVRRSQRNPAA